MEYLMMGLRVSEGIDIGRYRALSGEDLPASKVNGLVSLGMIETDGKMLKTTRKGRLLLNAVISELCV
tara:strand:- start:1319 stop:1522 length:204 start_codon:yes stop_codon:yes gene_type:complete